MRILSTKIHGVLDYLVGILLIGGPWMLGIAHDGAETWVPVVAGTAALVYSLITNYEWGAAKIISMRTHLGLDITSGILLAASPWLFGFHDYTYIPHLIAGITEIVVASITQTQPQTMPSSST
jgi:hypothetical protein